MEGQVRRDGRVRDQAAEDAGGRERAAEAAACSAQAARLHKTGNVAAAERPLTF